MRDIKKEFKELTLPLSNEEYALLEQSLIKEGCKKKLIVWNGILLDGYKRKEICDKHNIPYEIKELDEAHPTKANKSDHLHIENETKFWIVSNQIEEHGDASYFQKAELALKLQSLPKMELQDCAERTGVGSVDIEKAKVILSEGAPQQIEAAKKGAYKDSIFTDRNIYKTYDENIHKIYKEIKRAKLLRQYKDNPLPQGEFDVIFADFSEWDDSCGSIEIENKIPAVTIKDICDLRISTKDNAVLFLRISMFQYGEALKIMEAWNFKEGVAYCRELSLELDPDDFKSPIFYFLLVGTKGEISLPLIQKPHVITMLDSIEEMFPGRKYLGLFEEKPHNSKWTVWGAPKS